MNKIATKNSYASCFILLVTIFFLFSCNEITTQKSKDMLFEFSSIDDDINYTFFAKTSDPAVIKKINQQLKVPFDERSYHIIGPIIKAKKGSNLEWSWQFADNEWELAEVSIELCDGTPQILEDDLEYWINVVGLFCPWTARVLRKLD